MLFLLWLLFRQSLDLLWKHLSQHHCEMLSCRMLSFSWDMYAIYFQQLKFIFKLQHLYALRLFMEIHLKFQNIFSPMSSSTLLKVLSNWSKITAFVFPYITSFMVCISEFLSARRKHLEEMKPSDFISSLNVRCFKWNIFLMFLF